MIIDFSSIAEKRVDHQRDGEKYILTRRFEEDTARMMVTTLIPGASVGYHCHEKGMEFMYCLEGSLKVLYDGSELRMNAGQAHYCPEGHSHSVINDTDESAAFVAIVTK